MTKKLTANCKHCGSDEVTAQATAYWHPGEQEWKLNDATNIVTCSVCHWKDEVVYYNEKGELEER